VKTRNEGPFLGAWVDHHSKIVGRGNLIISDNMSDDEETLRLLQELRGTCTVFQFSGPHNEIHDRGHYPELYKAIRDSADVHMFTDTDERIVWIEDDRWMADERVVDRLLDAGPFFLLPGVLLENFAGRDDTFHYAGGIAQNRSLMLWGKPAISSHARVPKNHRLHNCQFPPDLLPLSGPVHLFSLHLCRLHPQQRLASNRNKLASRGLIDPHASFEEIARTPEAVTASDRLAGRYVREISTILAMLRGDSGARWGPSNETESLALRPDGSLFFGNAYIASEFRKFNARGLEYLLEA
jgi:hypothetical protein